jgi:DNA-binding NtrC family response regulator
MLLGTDSEVRESVRDYFGGETPLLEVETFAEIPATAEAKNVAAVFFDRAWLAEPEARQALLRLSGRLPQRPMVGISSYLTLSVARAAPDGSEFAAFLTKPLSPDALAGVLSDKKRQEAIS